ncbi:MAG: PglZ domain-containing protein [Bacillota bacterium]
MISPIFRIIKDEYSIFENKLKGNEVIVKNDKDYAESRVLIEKNKESMSSDLLNIIIQNKNYFGLYLDIEEMGKLSQIKVIDPVEVFEEEFNYQLPSYISADFLLANKLIENVSSFNEFYDNKFNFQSNLLMFYLEIDYLNSNFSLQKVLNFLYSRPEKLNLLQRNKYLFNIFKENILDKLKVDEFIINDITRMIKEKKYKEYLNFLLSCYIFSNYKKYHFKNVLSRIDYKVDIKIDKYYDLNSYTNLEVFCNNLYEEKSTWIRELNNELETLEGKIDIFSEDFEYEYYLKSISGYLEYEFDYLIFNMLKDLKTGEPKEYYLALISKVEKKFNPLFNNYGFKIILEQIRRLFDLLYKLQENKNILREFQDWASFYIEDYLRWNNDLEEEKNIFSIIKSLSERYDLKLDNIKRRIEESFISINKEYEKFLFENYNSLLGNKERLGCYQKLNKIKQILNRGKSVILIVIDAMRWDIWEIINGIFEEQGFVSNSKTEQVCLSLIPSVTNVSRRALFAGMKYDSLQQKKMDNKISYSIDNEKKLLNSYFQNENVAFAKGGKDDFKKLINEKADLYTFIYTSADDMFHGLKDINKELIKALFKTQIKNIAEAMKAKDHLEQSKIIVTTDHGSIKIKDKDYKSLSKGLKSYINNQNLNYKSHGRYLKIYGDEFIKDKYDKMRNYLKQNEKEYWYIIDREKMSDFYLPCEEINGENYFWLISKYGYYSQGTRGDYAHGGLSMNETIIPFSILEKKDITFKGLSLKVVESNLVSEESSFIKLVIFNNNDYALRNLRLKFNYFSISREINFINSNDKYELKVNLLPKSSGEIEEKIIIDFEFAGDKKSFTEKKILNIKESSKTKINKTLQNSRELF